MPRPLTLATVAVLGLVVPSTLLAQDNAAVHTVAPGSRVRIASPALLHPMTGTLVAMTPDTLRMRADGSGDTVSLAMPTLSRVELSGGAHTHRLRDTGIGLLAGFGIGAVWGLAAYQKSDCAEVTFCYDYGPGGDAVAGGVIIGTVGSIVGFIAGSFAREQWLPASGKGLPMRMSVSPAHDGTHALAVTASLRF